MQNHHVHAFLDPDEWNIFQNIIHEGNMYVLQNFQVKESTGNLRPVSSNMSIVFTHMTTMTPLVDDLPAIPMHKFEFVQLQDLRNFCNSYSSDLLPTNSIG